MTSRGTIILKRVSRKEQEAELSKTGNTQQFKLELVKNHVGLEPDQRAEGV